MKKRILSILLVALMVVSLLPTTATAAIILGPTINSNKTWKDGDVIPNNIQLTGGTKTNPTVITVTGTVLVGATINISGYVRITGGGTLKRASSNYYNNMLSMSSGELTLDNITIDGSNISSSYAGIYVGGGTLTINEGTVLQNHVRSGSDGSVLQMNSGTVVMNGGRIQSNQANSYGNIYMDGNAKFTLNGGTVTGNRLSTSSSYGGGAFYVRTATLVVNGGTISNNYAGGRGGGIYCTSYGKVYLNGGTITGNDAGGEGDGIFFSCREGSGSQLYIGGDPLVKDSIYLDSGSSTTKYPYITSAIKNPLTLEVNGYLEGRVIAVGSNYTLTESDMAKITLKTTDGTTYYSKLDRDNNRLLMTKTDPGYIEKYYVSYYGNGGTGSTLDNHAYASGETATVKSNGFQREGYIFSCWNTKSDGTGTSYNPGDSISMSKDVTLYAIWQDDITTYSVTFDTNGGTILSGEVTEYTVGVGVVLPTNVAKNGYTFDGWYSNAGLTGTAVAAINASATGDKTFYAKWTALPARIDNVSIIPGTNIKLIYGYDNAHIQVEGNASGHSFAYQWYSSTTKSNTGGTPIDGATGNYYYIPTGKDVGTEYYYCVATATRVDNGQTATEASDPITVTIEPRQVTLTSATASKYYDGTALTDDTITVGGDGFAADEGATYNVTGTQTVVGTSENSFTYTLNDNTKAENYNIIVDFGTLTVEKASNPFSVSITGWMYGEAANAPSVTNNPENGTVTYLYKEQGAEDSTYTDVVPTAAGRYTVQASVEGTANYNGGTDTADFTIAKRNVTLTSATVSKAYDGTALTDDTITVSGDGFAAGEGATYNVTGTQTEAGTSENSFAYTLNDNTNADNYDITVVIGKLTVTKADIPLSVGIEDWTYGEDANAPSVTGNTGNGTVTYLYKEQGADDNTYTDVVPTAAGAYTVKAIAAETENYNGGTDTADFTIAKKEITAPAEDTTSYTYDGQEKTYQLADNDDYTISNNISQTDAGSYTITVALKDKDNTVWADTKTSVDKTFTFTIAKRRVTLTSATETKVYDGTALTNDTVTVGGDGFAAGESATYNVTGTRTEVGTSNNTFTYTLNDNTNADNYDITEVIGKLTVTKAQAVITVDDSPIEVTFGETVTLPDATSDFGTVTCDKTAADLVNAGSYTVTYSVEGTDNYFGASVSISVTVKKKPVAEPTVSGTYTYTSEEQTVVLNGVESYMTVDETTTKATNAGTYTVVVVLDNNHTWNVNSDGNVQWIIGKAPLTITANDQSITYGDEAPVYDVTYNDFVGGETNAVLSGTLALACDYAQFKNQGTYTITPSGLTSNNYAITYENGTLTVNKKVVGLDWSTFTEKALVYSASAKTMTATATGLVNNDICTVTVKPVGDNVNVGTFYYEAIELSNSNYALPSDVDSPAYTITPKPLTITANNKSITYGDEAPVYDVTYNGFAGSETNAVLSGTLALSCDYKQFDDQGTYTITPSGLTSNNYAITYKNGTLTVNKKVVGLDWSTFTEEELVYSKTEKTMTATATGLVNGDSCTVTVELQGDNVNTGTFYYKATGLSNDNYTLPSNVDSPDYTITPKPLTVTAHDKVSIVGPWMPTLTYEIEGLIDGDTILVELSCDAFTLLPGKTPIIVTAIDPNGNYDITTVDGILTVLAFDFGMNCSGGRGCPLHSFTDLDATAWYHDGVHYCIDEGLMNGVGNNQFDPNGSTTRAMLVTVLWRLEGSPLVRATKNFSDVPAGQWYSNAIAWATANNIVNGYGDSTFGPSNQLTREQVMAIFNRYAASKGATSYEGVSAQQYFCSAWAKNDVSWAAANGLLDNLGVDVTNMTAAASRAELATYLYRVIENIMK